MLPPGEPQNTLCSVKEATQETTYSINAFTGNVHKKIKKETKVDQWLPGSELESRINCKWTTWIEMH